MPTKPKLPLVERRLLSRRQVGELCGGISVASVKRLEREGLLRPVKLTKSPSAMVFYAASEVHALVDQLLSNA